VRSDWSRCRSHEYEPRLAVSRRGEIYLADPNNRRINVYDQNGKFLRAIKIPKEFLTYIGEDTIAIVEGMGVDSKGFVYIASSSAYHSLLKKSLTTYGEVVLKIDQTGAVVDQYVFEGGYVYPVRIQEDINGKVYLVGSWSPYFIDVPVPLNLGAGKVFSVSGDYLRSLVNREYKFDTSEDGTTVRIGEYNSQRCFIFQDAEGRIKKAVPFRRWRCRYYKHSWRFPYKDTEYGVLLTVSGVFDKNLNYYEVAGTPSHLLVIKYVLEEVWK